nr:MarR family winged helix-turn-helix transcriptional regulator [uncultured Mailhella sp.]
MKISGCNINRIQFIILREIYSKSDLSQTALARLIGMDRNNLSRICTELEKLDLICRKVRTNDKRHYTLELTEYGRKVYLRGNHAMENYRILTHEMYSTEEWQNFKSMLQEFFTTLVGIMDIADEDLVPDAFLRGPLELDEKNSSRCLSSEQPELRTANADQGVNHD